MLVPDLVKEVEEGASTIPAIRDECRVGEEGMVLCTRGALSGMSAG